MHDWVLIQFVVAEMEVNRALLVTKYGLFFSGHKNKSFGFQKFYAPNDKEGRSASEILEYALLGSLYMAFVVDG